MHVRINDTVEVITGDERGTRGKVLRIEHKSGKLTVEGINRVYKHVRRSQRNPQGGRLSKEMPIPVSNVKLVCQACHAATRVGFRYTAEGAKERFCKKCGAANGQVSPPKPRYANQQA